MKIQLVNQIEALDDLFSSLNFRFIGNKVVRILLYLITVGLVSAGGLTIEIVAGRMLAPYIGMSLYTWTAIIAVVLAGLSIGHWIGGRLADKSHRDTEFLIGWILLLSSISAVASLILLRILSGPIMNLGMPPVPTISLLTFSLFFLPSFFIGIPSPMLTKLAIERGNQNMGQIVGLMYASGSVGGILGTLAAGYIFISFLGTINTIILVALMYLALSVIFLTFSLRGKYSAFLGYFFTVCISLGLVYGIGKATQAFESHCTNESDYYCIRIVDISRELGQEARLMVLDHLGHGMNLKDNPGIFQSSYIELTDLLVKKHFTDHSSIRSYFIGGGAFTLPRAWSKQYPRMNITVAEIDPTVTTLAMSEMWVSKVDNLNIIDTDGRIALRASDEAEYDVIVGDAFHDIAVPQHLITNEFFNLVRSRLNDNGLYLMTVVDHVHNPRFLLSVYMTLKKSFTHVQIWLDEEQDARASFLLSASETPINLTSLKSDVFPNRAWIKWSEQLIKKLVTTYHPLTLTDNFAPVDRLITAH